MELIGRLKEREKLATKVKSKKAELVVIIGRRRIGRTFLIRETFKNQLFFQFTGLYKSNLNEHLERFAKSLSNTFINGFEIKPPASWFEAFDLLAKFIEESKSKKKKIIFLDEFPWMASNKSRFLTAFTDFWNSFASRRKDIMIIICGSSASWMINKVLKNKGGLHNRVTERIFLEPFTLKETEIFLKKKNIIIDRIGITQLYMAMGGIPFYLEQINTGESHIQAMNNICFKKGAILKLEYDELLASLFDHSEKHEKIILELSKKPRGLTRELLIKKTGIKTGGGLTRILEELEFSGFISIEIPFGKKSNEKIIKLKDYYTLFYMKYIKNSKACDKTTWQKIAVSPTWISWSGLAFENICHDHINNIKKALKIEGIKSDHSAWQSKGNEEMKGAQIDLIVDRADNIINMCEIKYVNEPFVINADYIKKMRLKIASFKYFEKTKKVLFPTMITTFGLIENKHSAGFIQNEITLDDLFK